MPSVGLSVQCAQIFWTPSDRLLEYQCSFCGKSFLWHNECLAHYEHCPVDRNTIFKLRKDSDGNTQLDKLDSVSYDRREAHHSDNELATHQHVDYEKIQLEFVPVSDGIGRNEPNATFCKTASNQNRNTNKTSPNPRSKSHHLPSGRANSFSTLIQSGLGLLTCDICGHTRATRVGMLHHMIDSHKPKKPTPSKEVPPMQCPHCPKIFTNKYKYQSHQYVHTKSYSCEICGKTFTQKGNLNVHLRVHSGVRPYDCKVCGKTYATTTAINRHNLLHLGVKPFKCPHCPMAFVLSKALKVHINVHTLEDARTCEECGKVLKNSVQYRRHRMTHTGERPHECKVCTRRFAQIAALRMHMNTHTGNSPFACRFPLCDRRFHSNAARRSHEKSLHKVL